MKKILSVSIMAMLAVSPMMAHAADPVALAADKQYKDPVHTETANAASTDPQYVTQTIYDVDKTGVASAAYVKGAYNSAIRAINKVAATANAAQTSEQVANAVKAGINAADGNGLQDDENGHLSVKANNDGTIVVNGDGVKVGEITASNVANSALQTGTTTADNAKLATKAYVDDTAASAASSAITALDLANTYDAKGAGTNAVNLAGGAGLTAANGSISVGAGNGITVNADDIAVKAADTTITVDANGVKVGTITTGNLTGSLATAGSTNNDKLATQGYVDTATANMAVEDGVKYTIKRATYTTTGTVPMFSEWGDAEAGTIAISANTSVNTVPTYYTSAQ